MSDTVFRSSAPPPPVTPQEPTIEAPKNEIGSNVDLGMEEPVEGQGAEEAVLLALGVEDPIGIPPEDRAHLADATEYILELVRQRGATPTESTIKRVLDSLKEGFDLDPQAEPGVVLERLGGLVQAWKGLAFMKDPAEKRRTFMQLSRMKSAQEMDDAVFRMMEGKRIWQ